MSTLNPDDPQGLAVMAALLDIEWKQATEGFATTPSTDNWTRLITIMHARQYWAGQGLDERNKIMGHLWEHGVSLWVPHLYSLQMLDMQAAERSARVHARHLPKTRLKRGRGTDTI